MRHLLEYQADPMAFGGDGSTALMNTCWEHERAQGKNNLSIIDMLLKVADPNVQSRESDNPDETHNFQGATALHIASFNGYTACAKLLISGGSDPALVWTEPDPEGPIQWGTAAQIADAQGHTELATELRRLVAVQRKKNKNQARKQRKEKREHREKLLLLETSMSALSLSKESEPSLDTELTKLVESGLAAISSGVDESSKAGGSPDSPPVSLPVGSVV